MLTITQALGDFGKLLGGFFGEELSGFFGIQAFRISEGSAQPSPPDDLDAPFSKVKNSPFGSAVMGATTPSNWQRSLKCDCEAERSLSSTAFHFVMKSCGFTIPTRCANRGEPNAKCHLICDKSALNLALNEDLGGYVIHQLMDGRDIFR